MKRHLSNERFVPGGVFVQPVPMEQQQQQPFPTSPQEQETQQQLTTPPTKKPANVASLLDESGKLQFKKIFMSRKKSSVRAKEKKIRQNRQLRKAILPKNAKMALNEVKGISISDFTTNSNATGFTALFTANGKEYEGRGPSKTAAKNNACEKALRDYVLEKMRRKPRAPKTVPTPSTSESMDVEKDSQSDGEKSGDEDNDDIPMINLASFAIYKLFTEWEAEGFEVPELHPCVAPEPPAQGDSPSGKRAQKRSAVRTESPAVRTQLPPDWETMHPVNLLCIMRPALTYRECPAAEKPPFSFSVNVDGEEFVGTGRNKRSARRNVAVEVCNKLFGTNFIKGEIVSVWE